MSAYKDWAKQQKDGPVRMTPTPPKADVHAYVEGRFIFYTPTFYPSPELKEWGGVRWDGSKQAWRVPRLTRMARKIMEYDEDAKVSVDVKNLAAGEWEQRDTQVAQGQVEQFGLPEAYQLLYPFQQQSVIALTTRPYHGKMLILSPGLGKTPTSIIGCDVLARFKEISLPRFLVVAPLSLTFNWMREIETWSENQDSVRVHGKDGVGTATWTVTNPESLFERARATEGAPMRATGQLDPIFDLEWDAIILDESILYKNRKSKRSQIVRSLSSKGDQVWELSGAPITHDNSDLWQQLQIAEPDYFPAFWKFANEFCVVQRTTWSQGEIVGSRHGVELRQEYPELLFVRNQEEVFEDLPSVIFQDVELPLSRRQKKAHDDLMAVWFHELETNRDSRIDVTAVIAQLQRLQQVTSNLKNLETAGKRWPDESTKADAICDFLETDAQYPMLIWSWHRPGAQALLDRIQKKAKSKKSEFYGRRVELVQGKVKNVDAIIEDFKAGEVDVLILSIGVGKYGHTLANVRDVIYLDRTWDSDAMFQSLHRYAGARGRIAGFEHNPRVRILRCRGTVDDFVEMNLAGKLPDMAKITGADLLKILRSLGANYIEDLEAA